MNPPAWLPDSLAVAAFFVAGYAVLRTVLLRPRGPSAQYDTAIADAVLALAVAAMLARWLNPVPHVVWIIALNVTGYWFAVRLIRLARQPRGVGTGPGDGRAADLVVSTAGCAIGVYMLLAGVAPPTTSTSAAASHAMAGMAGMAAGNIASRIALPELGLLLAAALAVYATVALNRITTPTAAAMPAPASISAPVSAPGGGAAAIPRSVEISRIVLAVIMSYAIVASLV
jgi:hypothetical protein